MKNDTLLQHPPRPKLAPDNQPLTSPIYRGSKFAVSRVEDFARSDYYFYSRVSNPTVDELERLLAKLQGVEAGLCFASGISALTVAMLSLLRAGDHMIVFLQSYRPTRELARDFLSKFGVRSTILSLDDLDLVEKTVIQEKTKLVCLETCTNPLTRIADFGRLMPMLKRHNVLSLMDATFTGFQRLPLDVDLIAHSLTKYACGHGDLLGGALLGKTELIRKVHKEAIWVGSTLDPHAAYLALRGMKTYSLRFQRHSENALVIARWLEQQPQVERVYYPGLSSHPDHRIAKEFFSEFGCVVAFNLRGPAASAIQFLNGLKLFKLAGSLASTESLAAPAKSFYGSDFSDAQALQAGLTDTTVRLSVGLEDIEDLITDLSQALKAC